jgi:hypothetical protein
MTEFTVELPGGGTLKLDDAEEVDLWNTATERYLDDYSISKQNDRVLLGAVLSQQLAMFRAQRRLTEPDKKLRATARKDIAEAAAEIRDLEKSLGIDKKTREAGGQHTVVQYFTDLKKAAHAKGIHVSERVRAYEAFAMEMRWMIRLLRNGDAEDRQHHPETVTEKSIVAYAERVLAELEEKDKQWARDKGAIVLGRIRG